MHIWETLLESGLRLTTDAGEPIEIVYPGRVNDGYGADRKDVVITSHRGEERGAIEFHVCSTDWRAHGHQRDITYRNVILHVVMWNDASPVCIGGRAIPTLSLSRYLNTETASRFQTSEVTAAYGIPCENIYYRYPDKVISFLAAAGDARFQEKVVRFRQELISGDAAQVLYRGIMGALGYSKNKVPCRELAETVPLPGLARGRRDLMEAQALLLGTAGLLPSQRSPAPLETDNREDFVRSLEAIWQHLDRRKVMPWQSWNSYKIRPQNSPVRRIAAMAYLLQKHRRNGLLASVCNAVTGIPEAKASRLKDSMVVAGDGYWVDHFSFGVVSQQRVPYLVGNSRAAEIAVNILLPFVYARAGLMSDSGLMEKALGLYHAFPGLPANSVEKHLVSQLGLNPAVLKLSVRQQGLLHLYKTCCVQGRCGECRINRIKNQKSKLKNTE